ncbi:MAG: hypothetical protein HY22_09670 [[Candidatus Thermochlorobacteriaceae] bacterium GBChlB]|jgi:hypothetical protein|nr:MAG: hypothetical protein HY22_09670 [[Candidatus Thermochlorobacteriaceae] bacterium GBChlB]
MFMSFFTIIIRILFVVSTMLFFANIFLWIISFFQKFTSIKNLIEIMDGMISRNNYYNVRLFGLYAGALGLFSLIIYGISFLFKQHNEVGIKYVFIPILYGIIWIIVVAIRVFTSPI